MYYLKKLMKGVYTVNKNKLNVITVDGFEDALEEAFELEESEIVAASFADFESEYFGEVLPHRLVSAEEREKRNLELVSRIQTAAKNGERDDDAQMSLIKENRWLVYSLFLKKRGEYKNTFNHYELLSDCFSELAEAAKRYDPGFVKSKKTGKNSTKFSTFVYSTIENFMKGEWSVTEKADDGHYITICSLEDQVGSMGSESNDDLTYLDVIGDENALTPFEEIEIRETAQYYLSALNKTERWVVTSYCKGVPLHEIGRVLGCNGAGVKEIIKDSLVKMRAFGSLPPVA